MDHLKIEKAHVMGYSLGGFMALKLASVYPERLISAMPLASGWKNEKETILGLGHLHLILKMVALINRAQTSSNRFQLAPGTTTISSHLRRQVPMIQKLTDS